MAAEDEDLIDVIDDEEEDNIHDMYLTFNVADEAYAVGIVHVTEIVGVQNIVEVPDVPEFIKGVINLRGKVIAIMDIRTRFGIPWRDYDDRTCIVVIEIDGVSTGLVVDEVSEVLEITPKHIEPPPNWQKDNKQGVVAGMGKKDDEVFIILDVNSLVYDKEVSVALSEKQAAA